MAEVDEAGGITSTTDTRGDSEPSSPADGFVNGTNNGVSSEHRRKLIAEAEHHRTEQRRLQLIESQKRAEAQREKQREERKRRIEETRDREENRQRRAQEAKKEIERQYKDHVQALLHRNRDRIPSTFDYSRQAPLMRASHISSKSATALPSSTNGDRMATSFTVAFGSSSPRSICTRANEAALRSQAAFEARLASYLNGRHSGCFLTQFSYYTQYALYLKSDLLPENHPIRKHHQQSTLNATRRAASANPTLRVAMKTTASTGGVDKPNSRAISATRHHPQQDHRSRLTERQTVRQMDHQLPMQRSTSSQHFARSTIAFSSKVRGAPPPDIPVLEARKVDAPTNSDDVPPKKRLVLGRANMPRSRCNTYAAPTTASTNRQRAPSRDQEPRVNEVHTSVTSLTLPLRKPSASSSIAALSQTRGRSRVREPPSMKLKPMEASIVKPDLTKISDSVRTKEPLIPDSIKTSSIADQSESLTNLLCCDTPPGHSQEPAASLIRDEGPTATPDHLSASSELDSTSNHTKEALIPVFAKETLQAAFVEESVNEAENAELENKPRIDSSSVLEELNDAEIVIQSTNEEAHEAIGDGDAKEVSEKLALLSLNGPIAASTTGSGEGGCLPEEEAIIYRAKMAEQRRLAKERLAEEERREAEEERERRDRLEADRQAAIQLARERAVEEAQQAYKARLEREAAEQSARLQAERESEERIAKEQRRLEAIERERLENFRKAEEERAMRKKRLDSIMSRVNRSDRSFARGMTSSESSTSLGAATVAPAEGNSKPSVQFSLGPSTLEQSGVLPRESADPFNAPSQNGLPNGSSKISGTHFTSPLLQSFLSGGSRVTGAVPGTTTDIASSSVSADNGVLAESRRGSDEAPCLPPSPATTTFPMGTVANAASNC